MYRLDGGNHRVHIILVDKSEQGLAGGWQRGIGKQLVEYLIGLGNLEIRVD